MSHHGSLVLAGMLPGGLTVLRAAEALNMAAYRIDMDEYDRRIDGAGCDRRAISRLVEISVIKEEVRCLLKDRGLDDDLCLLLLLSKLPWALQKQVANALVAPGAGYRPLRWREPKQNQRGAEA